jgi:hypothetical protein
LTFGEGSVVAAGALGTDRFGQSALAADQHHQPFGSVTPVESRLRCSISQPLIVKGTTTQGYSLPWERWMLTA